MLDKLRDGEIAYNADLAALLLGCRDHINDLIEVAEQGAERPAAETLDRDRKLVERLRAVLGINAPEKGDAPAAHAPAVAEQAQPVGDGGRLAQTDAWHLSLRFGQAVMRNGMVASLAVFLASAFVLQPLWGNSGLWIAIHVFFIARAGFYWWALEQKKAALFAA